MLRFCDGFNHYSSADLSMKWSRGNTDAPAGIQNVGRFDEKGWRGTHRGRAIGKRLVGSSTWIVGVAFWGYNVDFSGGYRFVTLYSHVGGGEQLSVRGAGGVLVISRDGTTIATGTTELENGRWYYLELKATIHDTTGSAEVRLDGLTECSVSGVDTKATSAPTADEIIFTDYANGFGQDLFLDDVYVCDGIDSGVPGAPNNDFLGDVVIETLYPTGDGGSSDFTPSHGGGNWSCVDDPGVPNFDVDYAESATVGDEDRYTFEHSVATGGVVYALVLTPGVHKSDAGFRRMKTVARLGATETDSAEWILSTTWLFLQDFRESDPDGNQWTIPTVSDAEAGAKVTF